MSIPSLDTIHSFLVKPRRGKEPEEIVGTAVELDGPLHGMLSTLYNGTSTDCNIDIRFIASTGNQENEARALFIEYLEDRSLSNAAKIAEKLEQVTTGSSGMGLLFLLSGSNEKRNKFVISRFPADSGILADDAGGQLDVKFLEKVFMKNARAYKAVAYNNLSNTSGVWKGSAVDKQISDYTNPTSKYWIENFLESEFAVTSRHGTERLADALKKPPINLTT
ncbi:MAG: hypothetical protein AAF683_01125 [Pseudomonadota bacterium]